MKSINKLSAFLGSSVIAFAMTMCIPSQASAKGSDDKGSKGSDDRDNNMTVIVLPDAYTTDAGRLLGSQCAQCHGTNGVSVNSWDSIAGEKNLYHKMFREKEPIMLAQARGYTDMEISLIEDWLATLKKTKK